MVLRGQGGLLVAAGAVGQGGVCLMEEHAPNDLAVGAVLHFARSEAVRVAAVPVDVLADLLAHFFRPDVRRQLLQ